MKKMILLLIAFVFVLTGCKSSDAEEEISEILNERLGISPYIPETDYELGAVILEYISDLDDGDPRSATVNYYEPSDGLTAPDEEMVEWFEENFPDREVVYGTLYVEASVISIEIYPAGGNEMLDGEIIEIAGHEIQYNFLERQDSNHIFMVIHFDDVTYSIRYSVQSDDIEADAKELAKEIIKNNK